MGASHGKRSNVQLLTSGIWTLIQLTILIGGHVLIASHVWMRFQGVDAMERISELTGLPGWAQVAGILATIGLDIWIANHSRKSRNKARKR